MRPLHVRFFGTYDDGRHPRVAVLREGVAYFHDVTETTSRLAVETAARVQAVQSPRRLLTFVPMLLAAWGRLAVASRRGRSPDVVVVGHLGHLDIMLARVLFPHSMLCLDYLISLADTGNDRAVGSGMMRRLLRGLDTMATAIADVVIIDTMQSLETVPQQHRAKTVVAPVGTRREWFADPLEPVASGSSLKLIFYGLFTPLQGAPVLGTALRLLHDRGIDFTATVVGSGQDLTETRHAVGGAPVEWVPWVDHTELPGLVRRHDVCLGIFGTGPKARRVVPNKAYQGAAAGCVVVTSDTPPQRATLSPDCVFVPPGDPVALADALEFLAFEPSLFERRERIRQHAHEHFRPEMVVRGLLERLDELLGGVRP